MGLRIWRGDLPTPPEFHDEDQAFTSKTQEQVGDISRDDQVEEPDETEGSDEEREYMTLKDYYGKGKANSTHEKLLKMST